MTHLAILLPLLLLAPARPRAAERRAPVRAVHLTAWVAGAPAARKRFLEKIRGTAVNAVVVAVKETDGKVYVPGLAKAREYGTGRTAIPDPAALLRDLKAQGLIAIARIVVFKDDELARKKPEWAVRDPDGGVWKNRKGIAWVDPYRREIWEYNVDLASYAARLGFDEVQFDYIRFPSDGDTTRCRYSRTDHSSKTAVENLQGFLRYARGRLPGVPLSAALFGLTTTVEDDMGIGQDLAAMAGLVDVLSPMVYPSHYSKGLYGFKDPNREPYKVTRLALRDARARLRTSAQLRPYLQDFSLGFRYGAEQVRSEIRAAREQGIESWILWNPGNHYTWAAVQAGDYDSEKVVVEPVPPPRERTVLSRRGATGSREGRPPARRKKRRGLDRAASPEPAPQSPPPAALGDPKGPADIAPRTEGSGTVPAAPEGPKGSSSPTPGTGGSGTVPAALGDPKGPADIAPRTEGSGTVPSEEFGQ